MQSKPIIDQESMAKILDSMTSSCYPRTQERFVDVKSAIKQLLEAFISETFGVSFEVKLECWFGGDDVPSGCTYWELTVSNDWDVWEKEDYSFTRLCDEAKQIFDFFVGMKPQFFILSRLDFDFNLRAAIYRNTPDGDTRLEVMWE